VDGESDAVTVQDRSDDVLARRAGMGDKAAFAEIFHRHSAPLFRYALRMLDGDYTAAEDSVQEALTRAWLKIDGFRGQSSLRTWLFRMVANECIDSRRRRRPVAVDDHLLTARAGDRGLEPHSAASERELRQALDRALLELPWRQRAAWLLRELEQLSYEEIAQILSTSSTVVRGQLHRARATLVVRMEQWR